MAKAKKSVRLFETVEFDSYEEAKDMVRTAQRKRTRHLIALGISAAATGLTAYGILGGNADMTMVYMMLAFLLAIPAYIIGGGFGKVLKTAANLGKIGWLIIPFPYDILTGLCTFIFAGFALFCVPLFFTFANYVQHNREYKAAKKHLSHYHRRTSTAEAG